MAKDHPPTMQEVAQRAGVGKSTVSLALRDDPRLRPETRQRIREIAEAMGYRPNATVANLMAQLRASRTPKYQATLAILNCAKDQGYIQRVTTFRLWHEGCRARAEQLGYTLDLFWVHEPNVPPAKLARVLDSRGIRGGLLLALTETTDIPALLEPVWSRLASVAVGVRIEQPPLHFVCNDQYSTTLLAVHESAKRGYRRPGLVIDPAVDALVDYRFRAGFWAGQQMLPAGDRLPPLEWVRRDAATLKAWIGKHKPDILFTLHEESMVCLKDLGMEVPKEISLAHLDWQDFMTDWAGMNQNNRMVGSAALDMVVAQLHRNETGIPAFQKCMLVEAYWVEGPSARATAP